MNYSYSQICYEPYDSEINGFKHPVVYLCGHGLCSRCCDKILD